MITHEELQEAQNLVLEIANEFDYYVTFDISIECHGKRGEIDEYPEGYPEDSPAILLDGELDIKYSTYHSRGDHEDFKTPREAIDNLKKILQRGKVSQSRPISSMMASQNLGTQLPEQDGI